MANSFSKEEKVAFDNLLEGFQDALVMSRNVSKYNTDAQSMERAGDTIWRPAPYIMQSYSGMDQTGNFLDKTQLSVPASINIYDSVPWTMDARELNDAVQEGRLGESAKQRLASDINISVMSAAGGMGSLVIPVDTAATGYDDVALCEAVMNEQGIARDSRYLAISPRDYIGMSSNLASRATLTGKALTAYEKAYIDEVASFATYKLDYADRITAAAGTTTVSTLVGATNYHVPVATVTSAAGTNNVDNRTQSLTVSATASVVAGDAFTIAGVNSVHQITKVDTGQLKTFRVVSVDTGTTMTITPPIISAQGASSAEVQYQNCVVNTESATSAVVYLNAKAASINPFWHKDAIEILPGKYSIPENAGAAIMRGTTDQGIELVMQKFYDIQTMKTKFRIDTVYGVVNKAPEMSGIMIFNQA